MTREKERKRERERGSIMIIIIFVLKEVGVYNQPQLRRKIFLIKGGSTF